MRNNIVGKYVIYLPELVVHPTDRQVEIEFSSRGIFPSGSILLVVSRAESRDNFFYCKSSLKSSAFPGDALRHIEDQEAAQLIFDLQSELDEE